MAPGKPVLQCKANRVLVDGLQNDVDMYLETKKTRLVITFRRAVHSILECPYPIRCKEDAKGLKGIGDFISERIESILYRENLLNVSPREDELGPEPVVVELKKSDISSYVPRQGGLSHFILISILMISCETENSSVEIEDIKEKIHVIDSAFVCIDRKISESIRLLQNHGLITKSNDFISLTEVGEQLGVLCLKDCRLVYPAVEAFIQDGYLRRLDSQSRSVVVPSKPRVVSLNKLPQLSTLDLPLIQWPFSPPPPGTIMGEYKPEETLEELELELEDTPSVSPVKLTSCEEEWEVLMLLDNREIRTHQDRNYLDNQLREYNVDCERRALSLGDMQWVLHNRCNDREVMLNVIVERKNTRDLASSIMDGRFNEQQYRLLHCGCQYPIYLVEGSVRSQDLLPADALQSAIASTVVNRDIYVYQSTSIDDTVIFLKGIHKIICSWVHNYFQSFNKYCAIGHHLVRQCFHPKRMSFNDFQTLFMKSRKIKLKSLWCRQLRQIPRCTPAKSLVIIRKYPTMGSLLKAYSRLSTMKEKEELLKNLCDKKNQNQVGLALSRNIFHFLCSS